MGVSSHQGAQISLFLVKCPPHSHEDVSPIPSTTGKAERGGWTPRACWPARLPGEFQASDTLSQNKTKHGEITQSSSVSPYVCLHTFMWPALTQICIYKYIIHAYMCAPDLLHPLVIVLCFVIPLDCALLCRLNIWIKVVRPPLGSHCARLIGELMVRM